MHEHTLRFLLTIGTVAAMAMLGHGAAWAQMHAMVPTQVLSRDHLKAHKADLEAMLGDLAKVQTPGEAKLYETHLGGRIDGYVANYKALHQLALAPTAQTQAGDPTAPAQRTLAEENAKLGAGPFALLVREMARVERLNPDLKKTFDVVRGMN